MVPALDKKKGRDINLSINGTIEACLDYIAMGAIERMTAYGVRYPIHARKRLFDFQAHDMCLHKISYSTLTQCHVYSNIIEEGVAKFSRKEAFFACFNVYH